METILIVALASARLARLVGSDKITAPARIAVKTRLDSVARNDGRMSGVAKWVLALWSCLIWCLSVWSSVVVALMWRAGGNWQLAVKGLAVAMVAAFVLWWMQQTAPVDEPDGQ